MVVVVVADVQRVLSVACERSGTGSVKAAAVEVGLQGIVLKIQPCHTPVVVVHGDVEQTAAHLHSDGVSIGHVGGGVCWIGRPTPSCIEVGDDAFTKATKAVESSPAHNEVCPVGPDVIEFRACVVW